jgi:isopenicillin N synthase-like dioxygenase
MNFVPAIDMSPYVGGDESARKAVGRAVAQACADLGFLTLKGHGVPPALIDEVRAAAFAFFDLPAEEKLRSKPPAGVVLRGYTAPYSNTLARSKGVETPPDVREMISISRPEVTGREYAAFDGAAMFYHPNIAPARPAALMPVFTRYFREMERLARDIMRLFALGLDLPENFFDDKIDNHFSAFHALHYEARKTKPLPGQLRAGAHSDFGSLTILMPPKAGGDGLEVLSPSSGAWIAVEPEPGAYVINIGDLMQQWTNDRWRSTVHRVVNPTDDAGWDQRRLSLGFFCHPNYDAPVACLPGCAEADGTARYAPILAGDYMRQKIMAVRHLDKVKTA